MIILIPLLLIIAVPIILFIKHKKSAGWIIVGIYFLAFLWLAHPICQVNIPDKSNTIDGYRVTWQTLYQPSDLVKYIKGQRPIMFGNIEGYCKSWIGKQFFF